MASRVGANVSRLCASPTQRQCQGSYDTPGDDASSFPKLNSNPYAFAWLSRNAAKHGFEMSFGRDDVSSLGVSYEPWHWRWVGDTHSRETFARTREATGRA